MVKIIYRDRVVASDSFIDALRKAHEDDEVISLTWRDSSGASMGLLRFGDHWRTASLTTNPQQGVLNV